jgi:hypothetical protein
MATIQSRLSEIGARVSGRQAEIDALLQQVAEEVNEAPDADIVTVSATVPSIEGEVR